MTHYALQPGNLCTTHEFRRPPSWADLLRKWFSGDRNVFHNACTGLMGILRHTGGLGNCARGRRAGVPAVPMSNFGWCELCHISEAVRVVSKADELEPAGLIAAVKNELVDRKKKAKKRINFMMLMAEPDSSAGSGASSSFRTPSSAESGTVPELPAAAIVMKEAYYHPFRKLYPVPDDNLLKKMPFVIMRADHGHGDIFKSVLANVQTNATQDLLDAGSGVYHATKLCFLTGILKDGVCRMTRGCINVHRVQPS